VPKRRIREPGMIYDLNPKRPESEIEAELIIKINNSSKTAEVKKPIIKLTE
jgi:hypothetical protein